MNVYEEIIMILEKKGPATIPSIWEEITKLGSIEDISFDTTHLKSIIGLQKEWFQVKGEVVTLRPERDMVKLTFSQSRHPGPEVKISVNFIRNTFVFLEWHFNGTKAATSLPHHKHGSVSEFKKALYSLHIWNWEKDYQSDGIIVDGISWSIVLETKGALYRSEGLETFPKEWKSFYRSLRLLTGVAF
ncbi:hypothetical protein [Mesobacillus maritimus]|uniref:Uncharacterized protein n=1 Tax=Mesobacillus maritimus TaxID=1643336 RepID=A0ABS7K3F0_9BACI|nr:hypothetical protein [Mesobacillus maritimus]MBY0096760.1 hypothetical protein [Mesobacillus maritimus]